MVTLLQVYKKSPFFTSIKSRITKLIQSETGPLPSSNPSSYNITTSKFVFASLEGLSLVNVYITSFHYQFYRIFRCKSIVFSIPFFLASYPACAFNWFCFISRSRRLKTFISFIINFMNCIHRFFYGINSLLKKYEIKFTILSLIKLNKSLNERSEFYLNLDIIIDYVLLMFTFDIIS